MSAPRQKEVEPKAVLLNAWFPDQQQQQHTWDILEKQILRPSPRAAESEALGTGPSCLFNMPSKWFWYTFKFENTILCILFISFFSEVFPKVIFTQDEWVVNFYASNIWKYFYFHIWLDWWAHWFLASWSKFLENFLSLTTFYRLISSVIEEMSGGWVLM